MTDEHGPIGSEPAGRTLGSASKPAPVEQFGIETRRQKAELEAALFGEPAEPVAIAHYTIIGTLGSGGMGVVYVAHDQRLDRRVALKLLRHTHAGLLGRTRLQREAQAMARLSHPNVVAVHEVGVHAGQVFIAMEFVGGSNLRAWVKARPRSWREIIAAFLQAGEGLVAAHAAGLIHRDFKPDNVLVGDDGRVRVADFGLAHGLGSDGEPTPEPSDPDDPMAAVSLDSPLTETGAIVGTPAYMAPEQHLGMPVDARTDQFAFCVALWEALYGRRPFPGTSVAELVAALREHRIVQPEPGEVPVWLTGVLARGLARSPDERWPSMRELLAALARDPDRIRRRRLRIAAITSVTLAIIAALSVRATAERRLGERRRYWSALTEQLLEIERERGLEQANDDATRARNATRMSSYRRYRPQDGWVDHEDPTVAAVLLREVDEQGRSEPEWISAANEILGQPLSYAVLRGHRNVIVDIAFAPDSSEVYTAAKDNEVWRWQLATGRGQPIIEHEREVVALALSPDGRTLASVGKDRKVQIWARQRPDHVELVHTCADEPTKLAFDPSGSWLAIGSRSGAIDVVRLRDREVAACRGHQGAVLDLEFDAASQWLLSAGADRSARVWRVSDCGQAAVLTEHGDQVFHAAFVGSEQIVTGCDDGGVRAWNWRAGTSELVTQHGGGITALDVANGKVASASIGGKIRLSQLRGGSLVEFAAPATVWSLRLIDHGEQLLAGAFDGNAYLWSASGGAPRRSFVGHGEAISRVAVDAQQHWLSTGSYDGEVRIWDLHHPSLRDTLAGHTHQISDIAIDRAQRRAATSSHDGQVRLWSLDDGRGLGSLSSDGQSIYSIAFSPNGRMLVSGAHSGSLTLWDLDTGFATPLVGHTAHVWQVRFDSTGERLVSASFDGSARVWSVADGRELLVSHGHQGGVTAAQFEPGDRRIVSAGNDGSVRFWSADDGRSLAALQAHTGNVWQLVRSPDEHTLATASDDGTARLWPSDNPAESIVLRGHRQAVRAVAFDRTGARVVTASSDGDAKLWQVTDGRELQTLTGHDETVWTALFTNDGRVLTASEDNSIRVWSLDPLLPTIVLSGHVNAVTALALADDGVRLISGSADATAKLWHIDQLSTAPEQLHRRLRDATIWCLSADRRARELGEDPAEAARAFTDCERAYGR